jgi:hypothetical protein
MTDSRAVPPDLLREVIREVVREVIREVVAEEAAAVGLASSSRPGAIRPARAAAPSGPGGRIERGALTERHVRAAGREGTITIGRAVVVTPLAKDRARAMGVTIIRIEE